MTLHIDEETIDKVNADADRLDRSRGWIVRQIFKNHYEKRGKCCEKKV